ncbi:MAG: hypothetical protein HQL86_01745 [Magnetococcales bacterium]|nr:hypothetical protein [Magnetococcales bacterium]
MEPSLWRKELAPFFRLFLFLFLATLLGDFILHQFNLIWVGRYLGIPGTLLIIASLLYSLRKRKVINNGNPKILLKLHEILTWMGALMVMIHAGIHFNAILPWLAVMGMLINVVSGMVGRYLLDRSRRHLATMEEKYRMHGMSRPEVEMELFWDSMTYDTMTKWRTIHFPISFVFAALALGHILSIFLFWEWS